MCVKAEPQLLCEPTYRSRDRLASHRVQAKGEAAALL